MIIPFQSIFISLPIFIFTYLLIRPKLKTIFNPYYFPFFSLSASIGLMTYYYWNNTYNIKTLSYIEVILSYVFFVIGFIFAPSLKDSFKKKILLKYNFEINIFISFLAWLSLIFFIVFIIKIGFIPLMDDPTIVRTTQLKQSGGIFKRFFPILSNALFCIAFSLKFLPQRKKKKIRTVPFYLLMVLGSLLMLSLGTKSGIITILFLILIEDTLLVHKKERNKRVNLYILLLVSFLLYALFILYKDSGGKILIALFSLYNRIAAFGDIGYYFARANNYVDFEIADLLQFLSSDTLGLLRIQDYKPQLGAILYGVVNNSANLNGVGPNSQIIYLFSLTLPAIISIIFSFISGFIYYIFIYNIRLTSDMNFFSYFASLYINVLLIHLPIDPAFFIATIVSSLPLFFIIFISRLVYFSILSNQNKTNIISNKSLSKN